ncbi:MAG: cobaltochelatase subunit CobN [Pseudomonadota bacterium]
MHVLAVESGTVDTGDEAVDLGQSPGDIVVLSAADTELQLLAKTFGGWAEANTPTLRLANVLALRHNYSVDLYIEKTLAHARLIVVRLLGGRAYWPYGLEALARLHRETGVQIAVLPGDDKPDASLRDASTVPADRLAHLWRCLVEGDAENARLFLAGCAALISGAPCPPAPKPLPRAGVYRTVSPDGEAEGRATVLFYRALIQAGDLAPVDALIETLAARGLATHALYVNALRDAESGSIVRDHFTDHPPDVVLNATAFASGGAQASGDGAADTLLGTDAPWLQVVFSSRTETDWAGDIRGLGVRDVAMHVAMPEFDGRIFAGATAFKADVGRDAATEFALTRLAPHGERTARAADLATRWARLRTTPAGDKRVAIILANYPNRDSRMANGVGLSTPASVAATARHLRAAGFLADGFPATGDDLMATLRAGPTNRDTACRRSQATLPLDVYQSWFDGLPADARGALLDRWGPASADPFVRDGAFQLALHTFGNVVVGVQPARGYNIDPKATYHDPALIPPHGYLAFYLWLRDRFGAHAVIHFGKHGNLEWLPGKALALSASCWPDIALGGLPHVYPFIVNDPGEGAQAKRRSAAVIIDHMTPPMTRAESHGAMRELEGQLDEYAEAVSVDPKRALRLGPVILREAERIGLAEDLKLDPAAAEADRLQALDAALCDLKELQIRGGLHVFGQSLEGQERDEMLSALLRVPRGEEPGETSLQRALAADLDLGAFDPLDCDLGARWVGPRPHALARASCEPWRTNGDTVERIEALALDVIAGRTGPPGPASAAVLGAATTEIAPALDACGPRETAALVAALSGRFVAPGPSGAPTRGRADVLPTGRNFYSLDSRALPTPTAWELGKRAADALVARYLQDHGDWPRAIVMSAWGTSNMRTGGDDLAQALSLMGARPKWGLPLAASPALRS